MNGDPNRIGSGTPALEFAVHSAPLEDEEGVEVAVFGELDHATAPQVRQALESALAQFSSCAWT